MAQQQDIIREFLVSLGFKQDERGLKTFVKNVDDATRSVTKLVTTITGAALTVGVGVAAFASNLEDLYFAAQRTGSSATNLKAFDYAAERLGATANESRGAVEGLAKFLRENPGGEQWMQSLGIQTRDANGNLIETTQILGNLGGVFKNIPWFQARLLSDQIGGISDNVLRALQSQQFQTLYAQGQRAGTSGGLNNAVEQAHQFENALHAVGLQAYSMGVQIEAALLTKAGPLMDRFSAWVEHDGPAFATMVADWIVKIIDFGLRALPYVEKLFGYLQQAHESTGGLSTEILAIVAAAHLLGVDSIAVNILRLAGAFGTLAGGMAGVAAVAAGTGGYAGGTWLNKKIDEFVQKTTGNKDATLGTWLYDVMHNDTTMPTAESMGAYFSRRGYTSEQSAGLIANIFAESGGDPNATGDNGQAYGIAQWHPDRQAAFAKYMGKDIKGSTLTDQLDFMMYELRNGSEQKADALLRASTNARQAGEVVSRYYERPADADGQAYVRGEMAVNIHQNTQIHVAGSSDPAATGREVVAAQGNVNQDMVRNAQTAVR